MGSRVADKFRPPRIVRRVPWSLQSITYRVAAMLCCLIVPVNNGGIVPLAGAVATTASGERFELELVGIPRLRDYTYAGLNVAVS